MTDKPKVPDRRLGAAFAKIVEGFIETYLGDDKPLKLDWYWRYVCAWFGAAVFMAVASFNVSTVGSGHLRFSGPATAIFQQLVTDPLVIVSLFAVFVSLLAAIITTGIVNGGPIRLFLVGVSLPALVLFIATTATSMGSNGAETPASLDREEAAL